MKLIGDVGTVTFPEHCTIQPCASIMPFLVSPLILPKSRTRFPIILSPSSSALPPLLTLSGIATCVRAQINRILALPSLLGVTRCTDIRAPSRLSDIDSDNATPTRGDWEGCYAVTDLQSGYHPPSIPEADLPPSAGPIQIQQRTRHNLRPSDPSHTVINETDLDRDHGQHHQAISSATQYQANSTDGELLHSPDSGRDGDGDEGSVSCLVAGLYTRCSAFDSAAGYYMRMRGVQQAWTISIAFSTLRFLEHLG